MTDPVALVVDDWSLEALPGLERDLAQAGALLMRSFRGLPNPHLLRRWGGAAVVGGPDRATLLSRLELATASVAAPVIAVLPPGLAAAPELRGPGVVDVLAAGTAAAAERILLMARVPVVASRRAVEREARAAPGAAPGALPAGGPGPVLDAAAAPEATQALAVASSTGGVWILAAMLRALPRDRAVLVAQHLEAGFVPFFAEWLRGVSGWPTEIVSAPVACRSGVAYVAAGGLDLLAREREVLGASASSRHVPCGDRLLRSAAEAFGADATGLVLSGMGADGAEGLAEIVRRGGRALCQDPATAVVSSMPEAALRRVRGAAVAAPEALAAVLSAGQRGEVVAARAAPSAAPSAAR
ncbi:MAG TPA: CheB methylesterase domain-containing protein [Anaeromyxobacteraceae bacterium]|nr:CheB methylesterase domain-containing protein [Anaeromyxobacteraceae bacterium]